jgi:hypothetical protein
MEKNRQLLDESDDGVPIQPVQSHLDRTVSHRLADLERYVLPTALFERTWRLAARNKAAGWPSEAPWLTLFEVAVHSLPVASVCVGLVAQTIFDTTAIQLLYSLMSNTAASAQLHRAYSMRQSVCSRRVTLILAQSSFDWLSRTATSA